MGQEDGKKYSMQERLFKRDSERRNTMKLQVRHVQNIQSHHNNAKRPESKSTTGRINRQKTQGLHLFLRFPRPRFGSIQYMLMNST